MKFYKEFKLYEHLWDEPKRSTKVRKSLKESVGAAFDQAELKACLDRVNASAAKYASESEVNEFCGSICVRLSEEDLKKALRIGSRGGYTNGSGVTMPAQLVDMVSLEISRHDDDGICGALVELYGENEETGETTHDYNNDDMPFVGYISIPGRPIESDEEFIEFVKTNIFPKADSIAHDIISKTWNEFGFNDYAGITDYSYDSGVSGIDADDVEYDDDWSDLLKQADRLLGNLVRASDNRDYDDGDGYWQSEYTDWCFRYLYHKSTINNVTRVEQLCDEYSKKLPNVEFYFYMPEDGDYEVCEIGYTATRAEY
jgi:hypothetical protein